MRAVVIEQHGGPEKLLMLERPMPPVAAGEILVEVRAVGINHLDLWVRRGIPGVHYPLPLIPGSDVSGVVVQLGDGVRDLSLGDEVVVAPGVSCGRCLACTSGKDQCCSRYQILGEHRDGGCAERIVVPRENVFAKPSALTFVDAAAIGVSYLTAWHMVVARAQVQPGECVLIHAGASGVGSSAVQIAKLFGAEVIATCGSKEKLARAEALGADHVIDYETKDVVREVRSLTGGRGVDVVIEHVGEKTWDLSLRSLAWQGRLVTCGATTGAKVGVDLRHLFFKQQTLMGSTMGSRAEFLSLLAHVAAGRLRTVVDRVLPLQAIREAHELLERRQIIGKVVLTP